MGLRARWRALDRRARALWITGVLVVVGGAAVAWGPELRFALLHRTGVWAAEDPEQALTANAKEDAKRWEEIDAQFQRGLLLLHAGEASKAAQAFSRVLDKDPNVVDARVNLGFCFIEMQAWHEAFMEFQTVVSLDPQQANAYYGTGLVLYQLDDVEGALGNMRTYVHLSEPDDRFRDKGMAYISAWEDELRIKRAGQDPPEVTP